MGSNFKENLRAELDFQGVIVKELSARTKIPISTIDCYMRTQAVEPSADNAVKIAQALGVSVEYLVTGKNINLKKRHVSLSREAQEIVRWVEDFNPEQCRAVLRLLTAFSSNTPRRG